MMRFSQSVSENATAVYSLYTTDRLPPRRIGSSSVRGEREGGVGGKKERKNKKNTASNCTQRASERTEGTSRLWTMTWPTARSHEHN